jgi:hypothetical protein
VILYDSNGYVRPSSGFEEWNACRKAVMRYVILKLIQWVTGWWFGTMEFYDFPYIGNVIIPTDEVIFFRGIGQPPTSITGLPSGLPSGKTWKTTIFYG